MAERDGFRKVFGIGPSVEKGRLALGFVPEHAGQLSVRSTAPTPAVQASANQVVNQEAVTPPQPSPAEAV